MTTADEQIRVTDRVKRVLDRRRQEGELYNDVLERVLEEGEGGDVEGVRAALVWGETHTVDERTAVLAGEIVNGSSPEGPLLDGLDALMAAVGREVDAPVVSATGISHTKKRRASSVSRSTSNETLLPSHDVVERVAYLIKR